MSAPARPRSVASKSRRPSAGERRRGGATSKRSGGRIENAASKATRLGGDWQPEKSEELIAAGRVIDGRTVTGLGTKVDPDEGGCSRRLRAVAPQPSGLLSGQQTLGRCLDRPRSGWPAASDQSGSGRPTTFMVGRLDVSERRSDPCHQRRRLANLLAHPRYGVEKTYQVQVAGLPGPEVLERLRHGVHFAKDRPMPNGFESRANTSRARFLEMVLDEGKNREVRPALARVGRKFLPSCAAPRSARLRLGELPPGNAGRCGARSAGVSRGG